MKADEIKTIINSLVGCVCFDYEGKNCGVDPFNTEHFDMWFGNVSMIASSIDEVMYSPFFGGKSLSEISGQISSIDY